MNNVIYLKTIKGKTFISKEPTNRVVYRALNTTFLTETPINNWENYCNFFYDTQKRIYLNREGKNTVIKGLTIINCIASFSHCEYDNTYSENFDRVREIDLLLNDHNSKGCYMDGNKVNSISYLLRSLE